MTAVGEHVSDGAVLELIQRFLKQGVLESGKGWSPTDKGTPQGGVLSPDSAEKPLRGILGPDGRGGTGFRND
jgi:retron-type reverse transcriptase